MWSSCRFSSDVIVTFSNLMVFPSTVHLSAVGTFKWGLDLLVWQAALKLPCKLTWLLLGLFSNRFRGGNHGVALSDPATAACEWPCVVKARLVLQRQLLREMIRGQTYHITEKAAAAKKKHFPLLSNSTNTRPSSPWCVLSYFLRPICHSSADEPPLRSDPPLLLLTLGSASILSSVEVTEEERSSHSHPPSPYPFKPRWLATSYRNCLRLPQ